MTGPALVALTAVFDGLSLLTRAAVACALRLVLPDHPLVDITTLVWLFAPYVRAAVALTSDVGPGVVLRNTLGMRDTSSRERQQLHQALDAIRTRTDTDIPTPTFYVIDKPGLHANTYGGAIGLHRPLVWSTHLHAVLAHELGHLTHRHGRAHLAATWATYPALAEACDRAAQAGPLARLATRTLRHCAGNTPPARLVAAVWNAWQRRAEYDADRWAADAGYGQELIDYLDAHQAMDETPSYLFIAPRTHPCHELRIDEVALYVGR